MLNKIIILAILIVVTSFSFAQEQKFGQPSIEKMLKNSQKAPTESQAVDHEVLRTFIGFPYDDSNVEGYDKSFPLINHEYSLLSKEILKMYWNGSIAEPQHGPFLKSLFEEELSKSNKVPIQGINNLMAVYSDDKNMVDSVRVLAAILISGLTGEIQDIVPYLEYATVYVGGAELALGQQSPFVTNIFGPKPPKLTPMQRLKYWPSAFAIFNNEKICVPKLLAAVQDKSLRKDLRLRAATFLNTIDSELIDQELLSSVETDIATKLQNIVTKHVKWRHNLGDINRELSDRKQQSLETVRDQVGWSRSMTAYEVRSKLDEEVWGSY